MDRTITAGQRIEKGAADLAVDDGAERTVRFVASDESVDSYGDIVSASGWQLARFKKNPIFLFAHNHTAPIGLVPEIAVEGKRLIARAKFAAAGISELADQMWRLAQAGILKAVSVGFSVEGPDDYEYIRDADDHITGIKYLRQELLELSLVAVPANPNAIALARSLKVSDSVIARALPLDASVIAQQVQQRQRIAALRIAGLRHSAPRQAVTR